MKVLEITDVLSTGNPTNWLTELRKIPDLIDLYIAKNIRTFFANHSQIK